MRTLLLILVVGLLAGCSGGESGTVSPTVQQMKPSARGHRK